MISIDEVIFHEKFWEEIYDVVLSGISVIAVIFLSGVLLFTYRKVYSSDNYKPKFSILLVILSIITTMIINLIHTSLMSSLGLLGLLSIIRFRVKLKDFRDIGFILWAIGIGVAIGTENYGIGILYSFILCFLFVGLNNILLTKNKGNILVIRDIRVNKVKIEEFFMIQKITYELIFERNNEYIYYIDGKKNYNSFLEKFVEKFQYDYIKIS